MAKKNQDTPMMQQYKAIKVNYPDAFLFYRLGDFYELFFEDAEKVSQILEITLTARNKNAENPIPMAGVPHHSAGQYIDRLVELGYKVAICEQVEDAKQAKGMVRREVVQLITPGTVMEENALESKDNSYLIALYDDGNQYHFSSVDISTGELRSTTFTSRDSLWSEISSLQAKEILLSVEEEQMAKDLERHFNILVSHPRSEMTLDEEEFENILSEVKIEGQQHVVLQLLNYLSDTQMRALSHLQPVEVYETEHYLSLGPGARKNLELQRSLKDDSKNGTLLWLLDETETAMGGRLLKQWLDKPLIDRIQINERLDRVESLMKYFFERHDLKSFLKKVYDLERLAGRIAFQTVNARDLVQLKQSLDQIPSIVYIIEQINDDSIWDTWLDQVDALENVRNLIDSAIIDEPPISITEGGIIKEGFDEQLDKYLNAQKNGKQWLAALESQERETTGIKNLKIGFNKVFGYFIEVTKSNVKFVDEKRYERKQTLANSERYITPELKEKEVLILEAEESSQALEYELFVKIREDIKTEIRRLQNLAKQISTLDVLQSMTEVSERYQFIRPNFHDDHQEIYIEAGRHPVVEKVLGDQTYVPNDVKMPKDVTVLLITGPNMSGKSTYMRQLALTVIMAQIGCYVPATKAELPIFDQIFTRIGAMDDLIGGQSTFMVEMSEANIALKHATSRSLLLFDEIGRGTATFDGMALAEAIIRYIHDNIQAKTLFSTHYHELTSLETEMTHLKNVHVGAIEDGDELVFLHKIEDGPADQSYGVQVARLAGLPDQVVNEAKMILSQLEAGSSKQEAFEQAMIFSESEEKVKEQLTLFEISHETSEQEVLGDLRQLNVLNMTPLDAMNTLASMKSKLDR